MHRIDRIEDIDLATVTLDDLAWRCGTGISLAAHNGTRKTRIYRSGVETAIGDIEVSVWIKAVEKIVARDHGEHLLHALEAWTRKQEITAGIADGETHKEALKAYARRLQDNPAWVDYIRFNRIYRPDALNSAHIITVEPECCLYPGEVTEEQLRVHDGKVSCPHCGRYTEYKIVRRGRMTQNENNYYSNIRKGRCGYWDVCGDHACPCASTAPVSKGFDEKVYKSLHDARNRESDAFWEQYPNGYCEETRTHEKRRMT